MLILRRPWTEQPQNAISVAWGNPITRGLVALFDQRTGVELVLGVRASANTGTSVPSATGVGADYSGTANTQYPHRDQYAVTGAISIVAVVDIDALTNYGAIISKQASSTTNCPYELRLGQTPTDAKFSFVRANTAVAVHEGTVSALSAGYSGAIVCTYPSGNVAQSLGKVYTKAGSFGLTAIGGTASGAATDNSSAIWIGRRQDGATQLDGRIFYVAVFARELSGAEAQEIVSNPWQLFEPRSIIIPVSAAAAGTHSATGALVADAATIAGTAADVATYTSTGALAAQSATVAGTAAHLTLHTSSGALAADAATVAGTAAHTTTGTHAASGALAADAATVAGTATHLTLHTATGSLSADAATVSGSARDETTYVPPAPAAPSSAAGRPTRRRQQYVVEIDGEDFVVGSAEEAEDLLAKAKEEAEQSAKLAIERAVKAKQRAPKKVIRDAEKALQVPTIKAPGLEAYAADVLGQIKEVYASAMQTIEVSALLRQREREEEDDEDVLMLIA